MWMRAFARLKTGEHGVSLVSLWEGTAPSNTDLNIPSSSHLLVRLVVRSIPQREQTITPDLGGTFSGPLLTPFLGTQAAEPGRPTTFIKSHAALVLHRLPRS